MYEFIVMHARSDSLWFSLVHSVSLFLPLTHSGSLWLTLWLFQALWLTSPLLGSPRRGCMATIIPPCVVDHTSLILNLSPCQKISKKNKTWNCSSISWRDSHWKMSSLEKTLFLLSYFLSAQSCDKSEAATTCYSHVLKYFEAINYYYYYYYYY